MKIVKSIEVIHIDVKEYLRTVAAKVSFEKRRSVLVQLPVYDVL